MTGTWTLVRAYLRRDRFFVLWWWIGGVLLYWSQAVSVIGLYATQAEFDRAADYMGANPAFIALAGPARALNTVGGQVTWQASAFGAILAGLMSMFLIGRHTRAEEESGRDELVRSTVVGRQAPLAAAVIVAAAANLVLGIAVALSLVAVPLAAADSFGLGLGLTATGWVFTATALIAAQLSSSTRAMYGIAGVVIAASYVLRAVGDVGNPVFTWLSPIGWYQAMYPFSGLRWWPLLLLLAAAAIAALVAVALLSRRDIGSGLLSSRAGPARAGGVLGGHGFRGGLGLAWRLHRGTMLGWTLGMFLVGLSYGSIGNDVEQLLGDSDFARDFMIQGTADLIDGFYATAALMLALGASGYAISSVLRPGAEEVVGHTELLVATDLSRRAWLAGHVAMTVVGTVMVLGVSGLGLGLGNALVTGAGDAVGRYFWLGLAYVPAVLALAAVARLLFGLAPGQVSLAWLPLVLAVVVMLFSTVLRIPQWVQNLSPFEHLALVPAESLSWSAVLAVGLVATLVSFAGQLAFWRRDIG
ncbi:ABC transporter permease [Nocardioides sp.]|uniref:ABC transporter permease n=1 Tax=Nocardioides sp. TaxID=35761 RepID=UPI003562DC6D